jgi:vacuolar-type H+-ATPase subunit F/Vma7
MAKAVAVGEKHLILGFKAVGFELRSVTDSSRLPQELAALACDTEIGLVVVTESMASEAPRALDEFREKSGAILTIIPTHEGSRHVSFEEMRRAVERSLGVDILGKK